MDWFLGIVCNKVPTNLRRSLHFSNKFRETYEIFFGQWEALIFVEAHGAIINWSQFEMGTETNSPRNSLPGRIVDMFFSGSQRKTRDYYHRSSYIRRYLYLSIYTIYICIYIYIYDCVCAHHLFFFPKIQSMASRSFLDSHPRPSKPFTHHIKIQI